jgi:hypothetical protein
MKTVLFPTLAIALATAFAHAAPTDDVAAAARKLADAPNYSWTVTTEFANSQFPALPSEGVTEKDGYTVVTTTFNGNSRQRVRKGDQSVIQNRDGEWMTMEELRQQFAGGAGAAPGGGGRGGGRGGLGMFGGGASMDFPADAANLASKVKEAKIVDGAIVGTLAPDDAAALLTFGRGGRGSGGATLPAAKNASGSVKFWLKDGGLAKYSVNVKGTITTPNGEDRDVDLTTTTEFKEVGTTKVTVPEGAKKKLGG